MKSEVINYIYISFFFSDLKDRDSQLKPLSLPFCFSIKFLNKAKH